MPSAYQARWPEVSNSLPFAKVRCEDELVAALLVTEPAEILHQFAHDRALGVPDGQPASEFVGKAQQVEFGRQFAVVSFGGLLELVQVIGQGLFRLPGGAVDALQHRAVLVAAPVGTRDTLQLEVSEPLGTGHVRADAHVDERVGVAVGADHAALADLGGVFRIGLGGLDALDDLDLVRLIGEQLLGLVHRHLGTHERLIGLHDGTHLCLDRHQIVVVEGLAVGKFEVIIEAVLDRRSDRELGAREQPCDGLRHHVGGRVPQHMAAVLGVLGDDRHSAARWERSGQIVCSPSTVAATAALASRLPIDPARSRAVAPAGSWRSDPSGREMVMFDMTSKSLGVRTVHSRDGLPVVVRRR